MGSATERAAEVRRHDVIERLASFGPRPAGEAAEQAAAAYFAEALRGLGLDAWLQPFKFVGWEQTRPATVTLLAPERRELEAGAIAYSDSPPPGGVTGRLVKVGTAYLCPGLFEWPQYAVVDDAGNEVAILLGRVGGRAIPMPNTYPHPLLMRVGIAIGEADARRLDAWLDTGEEIRVALDSAGHYRPGLLSHNVIARLPGRSTEEIVVSSHLDTAPGAPGAIDNASGTQCVFDVAARLAAGPVPDKSFTFVAFGAEEYSLLGSTWYVADRKTRGTLGAVMVNLNLDTVGVGDSIYCLAAPEMLRRRVEEAMERVGTRRHFGDVTFATTARAVDAFPFHAEAIPNLTLTVWPYDAYHTPGDNLDLVDHDVVDRISTLAQELARQLDACDREAIGSA